MMADCQAANKAKEEPKNTQLKLICCIFTYIYLFVCVGMLRWTLHNRVDKNPSISVPLLRVLIKELEKVCSSIILSRSMHYSIYIE